MTESKKVLPDLFKIGKLFKTLLFKNEQYPIVYYNKKKSTNSKNRIVISELKKTLSINLSNKEIENK
jgi:hypothetical protein